MQIAKSLQQIQSSYIREILEAASNPNVISLAGGLPNDATFPMDIIKPAMAKLGEELAIFQYGDTAGYGPLLDHLYTRYQLSANQKAMITTGSQQGLDLIARAYIDPQDCVVMEAPSYLGAMQVFGLCQANIVTVEQNKQGPDIEALEQCFISNAPKLFYSVPDFHNPTGVCWSLATRKAVAALCEKYSVTLVEDAPYRELRFSGETLPMASSFCPDHSIVLRSFSKIAAPGLRIGMVSGKESLIQPLIKVKQGADLHSSVPMQALLLELLNNDSFAQCLENNTALYRERYNKMAEELEKHLPNGCELTQVEGGMFVWVKVPQCDTFALAKSLLAEGVAVVPSDVFYPPSAAKSSALRLNFTNCSPFDLDIAIQKIGQVLRTQC
jgi:DNA-binding transcriptional MocR family regulator